LLTGLEIDKMIARYTGANQRTCLTDALGSVIVQSREDQSSQNWYGDSPYEQASATADDEGSSSEYTARVNDNTGLYYYRAKYYDPILKRFVSEDPIRLAGGLNLYGYVGKCPTSLIDPTGNA
jgi:RHS repeat-associated protein